MVVMWSIIGFIMAGAAYTVTRLRKRERLDINAGALEGDLTSYVKNELSGGQK